MAESPNSKKYDLEDRTLLFARRVRNFIKNIKKTLTNIDDSKQLIRSSGSVGANYIEANESLSKKDFVLRVKICRKEAKENRYWLRLIETADANQETERENLINEVTELMRIFGSMVEKTKVV